VPWGHEFDFYLAIERIPIGLAVTLEFIGPLLVAVLAKTFCRLFMGTSCSSRIVLIAPWTNNGINVLESYLLCYGRFWLLYRPGRKGFKIMKDGEAVATGMLFASLLIVPLELWEMDSVI
jgi:inner membrane transporter RhtA